MLFRCDNGRLCNDSRLRCTGILDKKARGVLVKKGIKAALELIQKPTVNVACDATVGQLARALTEEIEAIPFVEIQRLRGQSLERRPLRRRRP